MSIPVTTFNDLESFTFNFGDFGLPGIIDNITLTNPTTGQVVGQTGPIVADHVASVVSTIEAIPDGTYLATATSQGSSSSHLISIQDDTWVAPASTFEALTPANIDWISGHPSGDASTAPPGLSPILTGVTHFQSTGPGDLEFSAAQIQAMEKDGVSARGPAGTQVELSDTAAHIALLLTGDTFNFRALENGLTALQHTGVTNIDVQTSHGIVEVPQSVTQLLTEVQHLEHHFAHVHGQTHQVEHAINQLLADPHHGFHIA